MYFNNDTNCLKFASRNGTKTARVPHGNPAVFNCPNNTARKKCSAGFTLMELTIVLAILAIIAAILIPTFMSAADRARLRSDIQSARVIHNAMELYRAERGGAVAGGNMETVLSNLRTAGFLEAGRNRPQTDGAQWTLRTAANGTDVVVHFPNPISSSIQRAINALSDDEKAFITPTPP